MTRQAINTLCDGDAVDECFLVVDKQLRANRNASLYLSTDLRDSTGVINARMWNIHEQDVADINPGDYVRAKGKVQLFQGSLQMILTACEPVSGVGVDPEEFFPQLDVNIDRLNKRLQELLLSIEDVHLRTLAECFLADELFMEDFLRAPAGVKAHHAYHGGLLEHVVNILETAARIVDLYPSIDPGLLFVGIFLHDIGKVRELGYEHNLIYTDEGQLLGHMVIGVEMLSEKASEASSMMGEAFPEEKLLRLKHMIVSHHGSLEFGSPRLPMTPEAIALHYLDNLDAKVHEFNREIEDDMNADSHWTPYLARLDRKLFKGDRS